MYITIQLLSIWRKQIGASVYVGEGLMALRHPLPKLAGYRWTHNKYTCNLLCSQTSLLVAIPWHWGLMFFTQPSPFMNWTVASLSTCTMYTVHLQSGHQRASSSPIMNATACNKYKDASFTAMTFNTFLHVPLQSLKMLKITPVLVNLSLLYNLKLAIFF